MTKNAGKWATNMLGGAGTGAAIGTAFGGPLGTLFGGLIGAGGGAIASAMDNSEEEAAAAEQRARDDADRFKSELMGYIPTEDQYGALDQYLWEAAQQGGTEYDKVKILEDPRFKAAQMKALGQLEGWSQGRITDADQARLQQIQSAQAQQERSQREALQQQAVNRGLGGSGLALMSQASAQQAAADRAAAGGNQLSQDVQQRALQSLSQYGSMAGQARGQEWGQQYQQASDRARAQDAINAFNAENLNRQRMSNSQTRLSYANAKNADMMQKAAMKMGAASSGRQDYWNGVNSANAAQASAQANMQQNWANAGNAVKAAADTWGDYQRQKEKYGVV